MAKTKHHHDHQERPDNGKDSDSSIEVLDRAYGTVYTEADLRLVYYAVGYSHHRLVTG